MKRFIAFTLLLCICFSLMTGCKEVIKNTVDDATVSQIILGEFNNISNIPRTSGNEIAMSTYLKSWAKENGFEVIRDHADNVIIEKDPTVGYENAPTTILQCNMDMICTTSEGIVFDPLNDPIKTITEEGVMRADGTSLGSDSGIGMATALYILKYAENHGPLRVIFTTEGETTMAGAEYLKSSHLDADFLINLGWEASNSICLGSAGTASYKISKGIEWVAPKNQVPYLISISGLNGGSAKDNIDSGGANAIKIIGETLANAQGQGILLEIAGFNGGISSDTIPTAASAVIIINESDVKKMQNVVKDSKKAFRGAYGDVEENYVFDYIETVMPEKVVSFDNASSISGFIYGIINGVQSRSEKYGTVESSSNIGVVSTNTGNFICEVSGTSTSELGLFEISSAHEAMSNMWDLNYEYKELVPIWPDHADSVIFAEMSEAYNQYDSLKVSPQVVSHELEMGWFLKKNPDLQMISIGPLIENAGLSDEKLLLESVTLPANVIMNFLKAQK